MSNALPRTALTLGSWIRVAGRRAAGVAATGVTPPPRAPPAPPAPPLPRTGISCCERRSAALLRFAFPVRRRPEAPGKLAAMMRTLVEPRKDAAAAAPSIASEDVVQDDGPGSSDPSSQQKAARAKMDGDRRKLSGFQDRGGIGERDLKLDVGQLREMASNSAAAPVFRVKSGNRLARNVSEGSNGDSSRTPLIRQHPNARRAITENLDALSPKRQHSFRDDVEHAAAETFLLTRLTFSLLRYLGVGYRWVIKFLALGLYAVFLMPGFMKVGYQYYFSKRVHRSIVYGDQPRNRLDLYMPEVSSSPKPVVIFITGGAWIIGYKAWGALLGLQLSDRDIMVCCVDYRNFPQGGISDMVEDTCTGIGFIVNNIDQYGGDPERIYLAGQSAGSHLAACALVDQARKEIGQKEGTMTWQTSQIKAFLGISGGYNLPKLVDHFHKRGLYRRIFLSVMEGETSLPLYSPEMAVRSDAFASAVPLLPPMYLFHGMADVSIPCEASTNFAKALSEAGASATVKLYPDKTHTDVFLQDPMRGGYDALFDDLLGVIHANDAEATAKDAAAPVRPRLVPEILLKLARAVSPF